jgi:2-hydroxyacyl-CoA lyase 1
MYVATASGMPLLVLGGSAYAGTLGVGGFQEADQLSFASPGCKWTGQVDDTARIGEWLHLALGRAQHGRPGAVYLDFPGQHVSRRVEESHALLWASTPEVTRPHPDPAAIERAAEMLASAERPLVVVGKGAGWADAGDALQRLVGLDIPYVASPMGRGVIPDDDPHFMNAARSAALKGADAILVVGARLNWIFGYGRQPRYAEGVRIAQIDVVAEEMLSSAPVEIGIVADAAVAVEALCEALDGRSLRSGASGWLDHLSAECEKNEAGLAMVTSLDSVPINPYRLVKEVRDAIGRDANVSVDGETIMGVCRTVLPSYLPRSRFNAGTTGCMGTGVPYAIGAALACPDRPSVAVVGDYAFGAAAMAVETAARVGARVVFVVANNEGIAGHRIQDHMLPPGSPRIASLLPAHYEKIAEMVDALALRVETPDELRPALDRALASEGVSVVHVRVDPKATRVSGSNYLQ